MALGDLLMMTKFGLDLFSDIKSGQQRKSDYREKQQAARAEADYIGRVAEVNVDKYLKEGQYKASIYELQKQQLEEQGKAGYDYYKFQADRQRRDEERLLSQMRANYGASGVKVDRGSPALVQEYDKYISDYNFQWNKYFADMYKHRQERASQIAGFEKEQAMRVARDQAKRERKVARLQQQKEMRKAGYYGSQIPWVDTQTGFAVADNLFDAGAAYDRYRLGQGKEQIFGLGNV